MTQRKSSEEHAQARAIGRRIRTLRGSISQVDFAARLGITRSALANYEIGRSKPPVEVIENIAKNFDLGLDALAGSPEPIDYENALKDIADDIVGAGGKITQDEWAIVRIMRVAHPEDVLGVVQRIVSGIEARSDGIQLMDPQTVAMDLARLYMIASGDGRYDRGVTGSNVVQLAKALAKMAQS